MAFHDMWGQEDDPEGPSPRPLVKWMGLLLGGIVTGAGLYIMLLPGGPLHPSLQARSVPTEPDRDVETPAPASADEDAPCPTPPVSSPQSFAGFIDAINRDDYSTAWSQLDPALQKSLYGGNIEPFVNDWGDHGAIQVGEITYAQPGAGEATLVATLMLESGQRARFQYQVDQYYEPSACKWLIAEISLLSQAVPEDPSSGSPTSPPG